MTDDSGWTGTRDRTAEVAEYLAAVREELSDLAPSERDDLLEDLSAHLTEVAAEDPTPLRERLGPPAGYAAELRAATGPAGRAAGGAGLAARWERLQGDLRRLDVRTGPLLGYPRASEFGRLLVPAWWVLRGYLAAMLVVAVLDRQGGLGLLPRLGGSTLVGLVLLAAAVAGSVWLARRFTDLTRWQRRSLHLASAFLVLFGLAAFVDVDAARQSGSGTVTRYVSGNPFEDVQDIYVVDGDGRLLTGVTLLDQHGRPLSIGWADCAEVRVRFGEPVPTYPRCPEDALPWLATAAPDPASDPTPTPGGTPTPAATPAGAPTSAADPTPTPTSQPAPTPTPTSR